MPGLPCVNARIVVFRPLSGFALPVCRRSMLNCGPISSMAYYSPISTQRAVDLAGIDAAVEVAFWFARNYPDEREDRLAQIDSLLDVRLLITSGRYP